MLSAIWTGYLRGLRMNVFNKHLFVGRQYLGVAAIARPVAWRSES